MKPSKFYDHIIAGNATLPVLVPGEYFKIMACTFPVNVKSSFGELQGLTAGQGLENTPFQSLTIQNTSASPNTIKLFIGDENFIDGLTGNVAISTNAAIRSSVFANTPVTVTNASAQIDAANAARSYLLIQNKSLSGTVFIGFSAGVTSVNGLKLPPGGYWEPSVIPTGAIHAIGDIASNPDVLIVEG